MYEPPRADYTVKRGAQKPVVKGMKKRKSCFEE
jgi:hypothetical protein